MRELEEKQSSLMALRQQAEARLQAMKVSTACTSPCCMCHLIPAVEYKCVSKYLCTCVYTSGGRYTGMYCSGIAVLN